MSLLTTSYTPAAESPNRVNEHDYQRIREEVDANIQSLGGVTRRQRKKMLGKAVAEFLARPVPNEVINALPADRRPRRLGEHHDDVTRLVLHRDECRRLSCNVCGGIGIDRAKQAITEHRRQMFLAGDANV